MSVANIGVSADAMLRWLLAHGVALDDVVRPWPIRVERVTFAGGGFSESPMGDLALILPIIDDGEVIDEAAWQTLSSRKSFATRDGVGWALGQGQLGRDGIGTTGRALPVRRDPLAWLRAHRTGIVIVDWPLAAYALAGVIIEAVDRRHAEELRCRLQLRLPTIIIGRSARDAAA